MEALLFMLVIGVPLFGLWWGITTNINHARAKQNLEALKPRLRAERRVGKSWPRLRGELEAALVDAERLDQSDGRVAAIVDAMKQGIQFCISEQITEEGVTGLKAIWNRHTELDNESKATMKKGEM